MREDDDLALDSNGAAGVTRRGLVGGTAAGVVVGAAGALGTGGAALASPSTTEGVPDGRGHSTGRGLELVLLGTQGGPPVEAGRTGISSVLRVDGRNYVVDCGRSAVTRYVEAGLKLANMAGVFITHLHSDHVADFYNFFLLGTPARNSRLDILPAGVPVLGPSAAGALPPKFGGGTAPTINPADPTPGLAAMVEYQHNAFAYAHNLFMRDSGSGDVRDFMSVREIAPPASAGASPGNTAPVMEPFEVFRDDRVIVSAILVPHGPVYPSYAYRFDTEFGSVVFSGDTTYSPNVIRLARGADILVHEAFNLQGADVPPALLDHIVKSHVEVQKVGTIADAAGVSHLVLSHMADLANGVIHEPTWRRWARRGYDGSVTVGSDLDVIRVDQRHRQRPR